MNEEKKVQREILVFLSDKINRNEKRKNISQAKKTWKFLAYCNAMDEVENWGKKTDIHKGQGGALCVI